jgi:hypothetical protein
LKTGEDDLVVGDLTGRHEGGASTVRVDPLAIDDGVEGADRVHVPRLTVVGRIGGRRVNERQTRSPQIARSIRSDVGVAAPGCVVIGPEELPRLSAVLGTPDDVAACVVLGANAARESLRRHDVEVAVTRRSDGGLGCRLSVVGGDPHGIGEPNAATGGLRHGGSGCGYERERSDQNK